MTFINSAAKTNWKFLTLVVVLAFVVSGGVWWYVNHQPQEEQGQGQSVQEMTEDSELLVAASIEDLSRSEIREFTIEGVTTTAHNPNTQFRVFDILRVKNLETGEERDIEFRDLIDEQTFSYLKDREDKAMPPSLYIQIEPPLASSGKSVWGRIDLFTYGDPPVPFFGNYFKVDAESWEIQAYEGASTFADGVAINPTRGEVLYDDLLEDGLFLYLLNLEDGEERVLVSYPIELFRQHIEYGLLSYRHPWFGDSESRQLDPEWVDNNTISYLDFETRQKKIVHLDPFTREVVRIENATANWQTYRNDEYGFEVRYPEGWAVTTTSEHGSIECQESTGGESLVLFSKEALDQYIEQCGFGVHTTPPSNTDVTVWIREEPYEDISNILQPPKENTTVAGEPAVMYRFSYQQARPNVNAARIYFNHEGKGYLIFLKNENEEGTFYDPLYDQILSTFRFVD